MKQAWRFMRIVVLLATAMVGPACAAEKTTDYAYGLRVDADGSQPLYEVTLPAAVYQGVTRRDLGDVRVFNGAGEVVPHAWRPRHTLTAAPGATLPLTLFPLKGPAGTRVEGMQFSLRRGAGGALAVDVTSGAGAAAGGSEIVGYLADLSTQTRALRAISFEWSPPDGVNGKLRIDASDDLAAWHTLVDAAPLLSLEVAGQRLRQKRVELPERKVKYLRLSWVYEGNATLLPVLTAAEGELAEAVTEAPRAWATFTAAAGDKAGDYGFDLQGPLPVDRLRLALPEVNTVVQVEVLARDQASAPWRSVTHSAVYRLRQGSGEIVSPAIAVDAASARYWLIRVNQQGGGLGNGMPVLNAGWVPQRLVLAARGAPPFTLAYGNRAAQSDALAIAALIPGYREDSGAVTAAITPAGTAGQTVNVQAASAQQQKELGGEARLREQPDWRRWSLWGMLGLGVVVLGAMAWRLLRQLGRS